MNYYLRMHTLYFCSEDLEAAVAVGSGIISSSDLYVLGSGVCLRIWKYRMTRVRSEKQGKNCLSVAQIIWSTLTLYLHRVEVAMIVNIWSIGTSERGHENDLLGGISRVCSRTLRQSRWLPPWDLNGGDKNTTLCYLPPLLANACFSKKKLKCHSWFPKVVHLCVQINKETDWQAQESLVARKLFKLTIFTGIHPPLDVHRCINFNCESCAFDNIQTWFKRISCFFSPALIIKLPDSLTHPNWFANHNER